MDMTVGEILQHLQTYLLTAFNPENLTLTARNIIIALVIGTLVSGMLRTVFNMAWGLVSTIGIGILICIFLGMVFF